MRMGALVLAKGTLRRTGTYIPHGRDKAFWVPSIWKAPRKGMFIGYRYLSNGEIEHNYDDPKDLYTDTTLTEKERLYYEHLYNTKY